MELDLLIAHFWKHWYFIRWSFYYLFRNNCLGYRWRVVLIVVDNAWWLGKLKQINWIGHRVWRLIEYIDVMYWLIAYMTFVYICCVWEEIWDVLYGLGKDRGWTSKPDVVWEEIGDGLHWYSSYACQIMCWYSSYAYHWKCWYSSYACHWKCWYS